MSFCIVPGCSNRKSNKNYEQLEKENKNHFLISFHLFPKDTDRKKKWLKALNLENYEPPKTGAVCSEHFEERNYDANYSFRKLRKEALPCLTKPKYVNNDHTYVKVEQDDKQKPTLENQILENQIQENQIQENQIQENLIQESANNDNIVNISVMKIVEIKKDVERKDRATSVSPERIFYSPTKVRMREVHKNEVKTLKKQLYVSSYQLKKARETIKSLRVNVKDLQKRNSLLTEENDLLLRINKNAGTGSKSLKRKRKDTKSVVMEGKKVDALCETGIGHEIEVESVQENSVVEEKSLAQENSMGRENSTAHGEG